MKIKQQHGFSVVEGLLIFVIVGIIGGTGWYVMNANSKASDTLDNSGLGTTAKSSNKKTTTPSPAPQADPTANWTAYSNKEGSYSLKHPSAWVRASSPELCTPGLLLIATTQAAVGRCATEGFGQMAVGSTSGDERGNYELGSKYYPDLKTESITVSGVVGKKQTGTFKNGQGEDELMVGADNDGDKKIAYTFYTNGKTYYAWYSAKTAYTDALSDFNLMVTKTLKFSAN